MRCTASRNYGARVPGYFPAPSEWFLGCLGRAIDGAQTTLSAVLAKARFWEAIVGVAINGRQRLVLNRLLDGFEGKLTTSKYAKPSVPRIPPCATFCLSSITAFSFAIPAAGGARVMIFRRFRGTREADDDHGTISTPSGRSKTKPGGTFWLYLANSAGGSTWRVSRTSARLDSASLIFRRDPTIANVLCEQPPVQVARSNRRRSWMSSKRWKPAVRRVT